MLINSQIQESSKGKGEVRQKSEDVQGSETTLYNSTVTDARHYTSVPAQGMHTPRVGPHVNCELWVTVMSHCRFLDCDAGLWREMTLTVWPQACGSRGVWEIYTFLSILL